MTKFETNLFCFPNCDLDTAMAAIFWQQVIIIVTSKGKAKVYPKTGYVGLKRD
jgi:hypothetical protein